MKRISSVVFIALALAGSTCEQRRKESGPALLPWCRVYFTPRDPAGDYLAALLDAAREKVYAAFYSLTLPEVADSFLRAKKRGVDVRVVMDDREAASPEAERLRAGDCLAVDSSPADFMHDKFMVIDGFLSWTGSYNPTATGSLYDDNNVVVLASREIAQLYEEEFLEMWSGKFGKSSMRPTRFPEREAGGVLVECRFSPEDDCAGRLIALIREARESVRFAVFAFTLVPVAEELVKKHAEGADVKGVFEKGQESPYCCFRILEECGVPVRWDQNLHYLHHKFFVIDETTVITGSFNPSRHAQAANDENLLIIRHPGVARKFLEEFERLWERHWE
jgi:phosphatidylserine/phosphatidylglycerophosphate/cardiolipin synthase-like enzyme